MYTKEINQLIDALIDAGDNTDVRTRIYAKARDSKIYEMYFHCAIQLSRNVKFRVLPLEQQHECVRKSCHILDQLYDALECKDVE